MTTPSNQQAYAPNTGTATIGALTFHPRDPSSNDIRYPLYQGWVNTLTKAIWYLEEFSPSSGAILAQWRAVGPIVVKTIAPTSSDYAYPIGQTWVNTTTGDYYGLVGVSGTTATWSLLASGTGDVQQIEVDAFTGPGTNPVTPVGSIITFTGAQVAAGDVGTNVIRTDSLAAGEVTIEIQRSTTAATATVADNGVCHFNSSDFTVDSDGFVSSIGGGFTRLVEVDAFTGPGTNPVAPTSPDGIITVTGGQVAAGTTADVIQTNSLAANTYTIQVQRTTAEATPTVGSNGVAHFSSEHFAVDSDGFVTLIGGGLAVDSFLVNSGSPSPVVPDASGQITFQGSGSITVVGSTNTMTPQLTGLTDHSVLVGAGTDTITKVAPSAMSGIPFVSKGASADPSFDTADVVGGGTGVTSFTSYAPICGGTTSTGDLQSADTGISTAGYVLTSTGASSLPTWQANASGAGIETINGNSGSITGSTVTIDGGTTGLTTTGSSSTMSLDGTLIVANGGTGVTTMTTAYAPICAGTTATGALQVASTGLGTSGFVLTSNGSSALPSFQAIPSSGITTVSVQTFDIVGANTYTVPANLQYAIVEIVGGGGGSGGSSSGYSGAGGGGGGGYSYGIFDAATLGASVTVTIGDGGAGGAAGGGGAGGTGTTGQTTTFGALLTANGGIGGTGGAVSSSGDQYIEGGAGGTATGGSINITGGAGGIGFTNGSSVTCGGFGGSSFFGFGGKSEVSNSGGLAGTGYGSGASGASGVGGGGGNSAGTKGNAGYCKITEYIS